MTLAENLKRLRDQKRWSQSRLAQESGVSQQSISRIENGIDLTSKNLPDLARALGVSIEDLDESYEVGVTPKSLDEVPPMSEEEFRLLWRNATEEARRHSRILLLAGQKPEESQSQGASNQDEPPAKPQ